MRTSDRPNGGGADGRNRRLARSLSGTNLARAGDYNQRIVLQAIRMTEETTRAALARTTGLTAPTIANITRRLGDAGLIRDAGRRQGARGQPAVRLTINPDGCFAIGLNIDRDHITLVTLDLAGQVRSRVSHEIAFALPEQVVAHVCRELPGLLEAGGIDRDRILGVGVALPDDLGRIAMPHRPAGYEAWSHVAIDRLLADALPWTILVDNDAAAAALGEAQCGEGLTRPSFFYILVSAGLGGGLVIDRNYYAGAHARSGEIGLMPDPGAGEARIVQDTVSLSALYQRLEDAGHPASGLADLDPAPPGAQAIVEQWLEDAANALVVPLTGINCLIDPDAILIGGRLPRSLTQALAERLNARFARLSLPTIAPVVRAAMAEDAPAIGAAILPFLAEVLPSDAILMQAGRSAG